MAFKHLCFAYIVDYSFFRSRIYNYQCPVETEKDMIVFVWL